MDPFVFIVDRDSSRNTNSTCGMQLCLIFFVCSDTSPSSVKNQNTPAIERGKKTEQADWKGQVTAREVAKKAKAQRLRISNTVVRVSGSSDSSTSL